MRKISDREHRTVRRSEGKHVRQSSRHRRPKKYLGQHFLVDEQVLASIIQAADLDHSDHVLEIGPGHGVLTAALAERVFDGLVLAIEKDRDLIDELRQNFKGKKQVRIVHGDVLGMPIGELLPVNPPHSPFAKGDAPLFSKEGLGEISSSSAYKIVANIPYAVTSPIITKFLLGDYRGRAGQRSPRPESMTMLVQKEVAERITAEPPSRERGVLTLLVELFGTASCIRTVGPDAFDPPPKVDSAVIHIEVDEPKANPETFHRLLKFGFANKRRQLHNSLAGSLRMPARVVKEMLQQADINPLLRAEQLTLDQWLALHTVVLEKLYDN